MTPGATITRFTRRTVHLSDGSMFRLCGAGYHFDDDQGKAHRSDRCVVLMHDSNRLALFEIDGQVHDLSDGGLHEVLVEGEPVEDLRPVWRYRTDCPDVDVVPVRAKRRDLRKLMTRALKAYADAWREE